MAVKKATSRARSTTKQAKTTRSTTKRATKAKSASKAAAVKYTPTIQLPAVPEPRAREPRAATTVTGERPSQHTAAHYLHATGPAPADGTPRRPGKWLVFVSRSRIDALWNEVRRAVEAGRLGHAAKASTALPDPMSPDPKKHAIFVYTANEDDPTDVRRVRDALRQLGINWKIPYKSDAAEGAAAKYYE